MALNIQFKGEQMQSTKLKHQQKDCISSAIKIEAQAAEIDSSTTDMDDNNKQQGKNLPVHD